MNNYYYSQRYSGYANKLIIPGLTMSQGGCFITDYAMILSYFNDKAFYPDQMLDFLQSKNYITSTGRAMYQGLCDAAGFKLRFSYTPNAQAGETTYGIRQVYFGHAPDWHWICDHPLIANTIIDPFDGAIKPFNHYSYTGQARFFLGKR